jgi:hypothetical protein
MPRAKGYRSGTLLKKAASDNVKHGGRVRVDSKTYGDGRGHEKHVWRDGKSDNHALFDARLSFPSQTPWEWKPRQGGEQRREEQRLSLAGVCVDHGGTVVDLCEGIFRMPPPSSGTTGVA